MSFDLPVSFEFRDEFNRKNIAEKVINLLRSDIEVSPLVVDGTWGLGKTEFCHKLICLMKEEETHNLIYVDAFKADHADEPLLTVLAKVLETLPESDEKNSLMNKAMPALRFGLKVGGKALVSHFLRQDTDSIAGDFEEEVKQVADKAIDASVESLLKDHIEAEKNLKALQEALKAVADQKPIVLFIDELDRCRPDFAVLMLETIKHTFDIDGVQFVLVTNTNQLKASIHHCYGTSIDAQRYLDKFLKFTFTLPNTTNQQSSTLASVSHYVNCLGRSSTLRDLGLDQHSCFKLVKQIITTNNLSLREVETLVRYLEIYQRISGDNAFFQNMSWQYKLFRVLAVSLVSLKSDLVYSISINQLDAKLLGSFIGVNSLPNWKGGHPHPAHYETIAVILSTECQINKNYLFPDDRRVVEQWKGLFNDFLKGSPMHYEENEVLEIIKDTINTISLSC